ncbi:conserved hypothetical protein [Caldicellulosiruptor hydrothermalis 108]|uniref:Uncharacterized protein n=1 Tax=Caldicellulosiruptor hydrothermalis (strain DSM 18901 / VKM B-2411 / 108) TaxID=632292 RepID=E4QBJ4_CALH1|nr:hypothetical protein [Caldicellulosiruptor hydrothermalis]ADQ06096.1 conserved hypothetical protein [Caldicellulosiruptor hydrothermalis 108]
MFIKKLNDDVLRVIGQLYSIVADDYADKAYKEVKGIKILVYKAEGDANLVRIDIKKVEGEISGESCQETKQGEVREE